jgi:hypothetical protein
MEWWRPDFMLEQGRLARDGAFLFSPHMIASADLPLFVWHAE